MKNVFDLAQEDTSLKRVSHKEYAGSCPGCGGSDRFHVQPDRKEDGAWMCRNCRPAEQYGWSDSIEYLRQFRKMSFTSAQNYLAGEVDTAIERAERVHNKSLEQYGEPPNQVWQDRASRYTTLAIDRLWETPEGKAGLDYLLARGLEKDTIRKAHLGYAVYHGVPCIVIPWYADNYYWRINLRDIRADKPADAPRYQNVPGSSNAGLYMGDSLKLQRPTFVVEGEIDALSLAQEAGNAVAVVATGTTSGSRVPRWIARLATVPSVFVAYDNEPQGEKESRYWLHVLAHNAERHRPLHYKDVNAMLVADPELLRVWIAAATYEYEEEEDTSEQPSQETPLASAIIPAQELDQAQAFSCSQCGIDLSDIETATYSEDGAAYCDSDQDGAACCSRATRPYTSLEQLVSTAHILASGIPGCTVTPLEPGYTLEQHIKRLKAERAAAEPTSLERAIMSKLKGYNLYIGSVCQCGCRLKWPIAGGMYIQCARCEPGGLWSTPTIELLRSLSFDRQLERAA